MTQTIDSTLFREKLLYNKDVTNMFNKLQKAELQRQAKAKSQTINNYKMGNSHVDTPFKNQQAGN